MRKMKTDNSVKYTPRDETSIINDLIETSITNKIKLAYTTETEA